MRLTDEKTALEKVQAKYLVEFSGQTCAPFNRTQKPREARNRRPAGWTAIWITLPKITEEGLQKVAITLAQDQQHSPWPRERRRYPRTKSHLIGEALDDFFRKLGFEEFCLQPPQREGHQ